MGRKRRGRSTPARGAVSRRTFLKVGAAAAVGVAATAGSGHYGALRMNEIPRFPPDRLAALRRGGGTHLLERFPELSDTVPWLPLGRHDTPVQALPSLEGAGDVALYIKRDDLTSALYGGNKVRKLEHLLAAALLLERRRLITLGGAGTNHGLATALHGRSLGLATEVALFPQPAVPEVERNVRGMLAAGARLHYSSHEFGALHRVRRLHEDARSTGEAPYFVTLGGSSRLGSLGYVNAALELAAQVEAGALPEPDRIFVALGSCGTAAGLLAGLRLAGLRSRVSAVRVTTPLLAHRLTVHYLANDLLRWLESAGAETAGVRVRSADFDVVTDQLGRGYGHATASAGAAADWLQPRARTDPTYTAKALAACLDHCRRRGRPGESVLYWHTANAAPVAQAEDLDGVPPLLRRVLES